ncbi:MAG: DUF1611 domain-containing protein [Gammaproteobacteria bacterium]|nr:DUF1611 domain-containing protein [Gammaproteobacteria bacterium]
MTHYVYTSVTRISDLAAQEFKVQPVDSAQWQTGDYVVGRVLSTAGVMHNIELPSGRMIEVFEDDLVIGAFGERMATLEAVGNWQAITNDTFNALTSAGLFGQLTSKSSFMPALMSLHYVGHVTRSSKRVRMSDFAKNKTEQTLSAPVILIVGTSMSSGKTTSGRVIVRMLKKQGLKVVAAKLTGAARYRDVLSYKDAGADAIYDFVDAGLPSTVCDVPMFRSAMSKMLSVIASNRPDVVVVEAGASPLEPYNGDTIMKLLDDQVCFMLLCASDPYAVMGVASAFARQPDLIAGGAANTEAGIELVKKLTGFSALNLMEQASYHDLRQRLMKALGGVANP